MSLIDFSCRDTGSLLEKVKRIFIPQTISRIDSHTPTSTPTGTPYEENEKVMEGEKEREEVRGDEPVFLPFDETSQQRAVRPSSIRFLRPTLHLSSFSLIGRVGFFPLSPSDFDSLGYYWGRS